MNSRYTFKICKKNRHIRFFFFVCVKESVQNVTSNVNFMYNRDFLRFLSPFNTYVLHSKAVIFEHDFDVPIDNMHNAHVRLRLTAYFGHCRIK